MRILWRVITSCVDGCCRLPRCINEGHMPPAGNFDAFARTGRRWPRPRRHRWAAHAAHAAGLVAARFPRSGRDGSSLGRDRAGQFRFRAAGRPRPLQLPARGDLSPEDFQHSGPSRRGIVSDDRGRVRPRRGREAFLAHNAIPVQFTEEDFDQVLSGNFVTKVMYLPNPEFQELALAGVETLVSTRLDPGVDPIVEADAPRGDPGGGPLGQQGLADSPPPTAMPWPTASRRPASMPRGHADARRRPMGVPIGGGPHAGGLSLPASPGRNMACRCAARRSACLGRRTFRLGMPAGLQGYTIVNHTHVLLPEPTQDFAIDVKQTPGYSYPTPPNHVRIVERTSCEAEGVREGPAVRRRVQRRGPGLPGRSGGGVVRPHRPRNRKK